MELPQRELAVLEAASADEPTPVAELASATGEKPETVTGAAFDLEERGLVTVSEDTVADVELTEEGERYHRMGLPEIRLYETALGAGADEESVSMGEVLGAADLDGPEVDIALSNYARKGYGEIESGDLSANPDADPDTDEEAAALDAVADGEPIDEDVREALERRDLLVVHERTIRSVTLTDDGVDALMAGISATEAVGQLTPEMLASGEWADVAFADYNVEADAETPSSGKEHVLRATAERVTDVLVGMGFEEMEGPHADSEFWINDALFMPQDHPARTHWDQFALSEPSAVDELPDDLLERVESAHREGVGDDGDGYHSPWTEEMARGVDLRGHTTSLSMRYLSGEAVGDLEPPQRYFSVEKVYRNDTLDATHLLEFFQIEGWVMAEDLSVRDLMGTFTEFYSQFGIENVRFKPHYNPYTEPSFELFGTHPRTGEVIEIGNSGLFRPEVLEPLGVECDVMAWGLALERLLMLTHGFEDIRDVHGTLADIDFLRNTEVVY
ncbi:phenylalanyl-tRNA synthetase alpha chain [Halarchaeum acidiphilum MH1-52-1]|uniref:Phenylalanine--tRNA ligase alpha subunit n=1 Tax=Halarchaeum acidiphilum MH1-52-1 TaxID=1261545 RepID=U3ACT6_9EURY|nr:phenylalanine--tRNA ligase subunit alpha [Halarchaeum acidiphilum]GAD52588.1 phenylalanyl-tRNA synthetase alpha chain [Halarchaeum acidiphilum MH1-52-1]